jgi:ketosteroid isomerase-like protein
MANTLHNWHQLIEKRDTKNIGSILADDVVMHSPVVHTPIHGKKIVTLYLMAAFHTLANEKFTYVRELSNDSTAILEFTTEIDGIFVNGVDMMSWNEDGLIVDFKVMVRPLKAVNLIHQKMGEMLNRLK